MERERERERGRRRFCTSSAAEDMWGPHDPLQRTQPLSMVHFIWVPPFAWLVKTITIVRYECG